MGYTHYWRHGDISPDMWESFIADAQRIIRESNVPVAGPLGNKVALLDEDGIRLNGAGEEESYESFILTPDVTVLEFCKTGLRKYDLVVTTILLRGMLTIPNFQVKSDGTWEEWQDARDLYTRVFDQTPPAESPLKIF